MSQKTVRVQRPRKAESAEAAAAIDEASEGIGGQGTEPDRGVLLTLMALPNGGNYVKRIPFSMEVFDDWGAQKWWSENYYKIMELYSIASSQAPATPAPSDDEIDSVHVQEEEESGNGALCAPRSSGSSSKAQKKPHLAPDEAEFKELDWVVEDEPGVFVTVDQCLMAPRR